MNAFEMSPRDFQLYLAERGYTGDQRDDLLRRYRRANSPFSGIFDFIEGLRGSDEEAGLRRGEVAPMVFPEGMSGFEAFTTGQARPAVPGFLLGGAEAAAAAVDAPSAAAAGLIPAQDAAMEALGTAGFAMGAGGAAVRPAGSVGVGGRVADLSERRQQRARDDFANRIQSVVDDVASGNYQRRLDEAAFAAHREGLLPLVMGTRVAPPETYEMPGNWQVSGYFVDPNNPRRFGYKLENESGETFNAPVSDPSLGYSLRDPTRFGGGFTAFAGPRAEALQYKNLPQAPEPPFSRNMDSDERARIDDEYRQLFGDDLAANADKSTGLLAAAAAETPTGIRAYHGSPHDFDRFSMDAIGTGEGAQAYGHGLYFTETPDIGRGYRDNVFGAPPRSAFSSDEAHEIVSNQLQGFGATPNALYDATEDLRKSLSSAEASNKIWKDRQPRVDALKEAIAYLENKADTRLMVGDKSVSDIYDALSSRADRLPIKAAQANYDKMAILEDLMNDGDVLGVMQRKADYDPAALAWFEKEIAPKFKRSGALYEVNISANPEDFLDWDKPLSEQSENVRRAILAINAGDDPLLRELLDTSPEGMMLQGMVPDARGSAVYRTLMESGFEDGAVGLNLPQPNPMKPADKWASERLREAGIPGIKYFDAMSRNAGEGSRNFVVFDENLINIVRKYGIAGAAAVLGVSVADVEAAMAQGQPAPRTPGLLVQ